MLENRVETMAVQLKFTLLVCETLPVALHRNILRCEMKFSLVINSPLVSLRTLTCLKSYFFSLLDLPTRARDEPATNDG